MEFLLGLFIVSGLLQAGLSVPLLLRKVGPNPWYGFRVEKTLADPAVWYAVNAFAAKGFLAVGVATAATAVALYFVPGIDVAGYGTAVAAVTLGGLALNLILSFRYLKTVCGRNRAE